MSNVLVTGGTGLVGSTVVSFLNKNGYTTLSPLRSELDLLDSFSVESYLTGKSIDIIIHCAGLVGGIQANIQKPADFLYENTVIGLNLIRKAYEAGIKNIINLGSSCIYPPSAQNPIKENSLLTGSLEKTNEGYAIAKISVAKLCEYYSAQYSNCMYKTCIPCNLYGEKDSFDLEKSHMIPSAIRKIYKAKKSNANSVVIWGSGLARREFMHVDDLADFVVYALRNFERMPQYINVGLGYDYSINEYYSEIAKQLEYSGSFVHDKTKPEGMKQKLVSVELLSEFGWTAKLSLQEGLKRTCDYYVKQQEQDL